MKPINIMLVEDNEGDIMLTEEAFEDSKIGNTISVIKDGEAAINYFERSGDYSTLPDLILLDINLPKKNGHDVLAYLKSSDRFQHIPVIMLTTSSSEEDILKSYKNHVNCYICKPIDVTDFLQAITKIEDFWINIVTLPPPSPKT